MSVAIITPNPRLPLVPDEHYQEEQRELTAAHDSVPSAYQRAEDLQRGLESDFMETFGLRRAPRMQTMYATLCRFVRYADDHILDHRSYYIGAGNLVLITQPYGKHDLSPANALLRPFGIVGVDLAPWAFYYPGSAECYAFISNRENLRALRHYNLGVRIPSHPGIV